MKCVFAIPTITGEIRSECVMSLMQALCILQKAEIDTDLLILSNCPVLPVARNSLVAMFMADPEATDLFFLDYDVGFDAAAVLKLLERPEEIVAGAYRVKLEEEQYSVVPKTLDGVPIGRDGLVEAEFLAGGFLRIKREVFGRMAAAYPDLRYDDNVIKTINGSPIAEAYDFFGMGVDPDRKRYTTEDYYFSKRWRAIGGRLWIYPDIEFHHIGRKAYSGNFHEYLLKLPGGAKSDIRLEKARAIDGWMAEPELVWLARQARTRKRIVELGCCFGRSTRALADNTEGTVYAVDDWYGVRPADWEEAVRKGVGPLFHENLADHIESGKVLPVSCDHGDEAKLPNVQPDMVFIDGSHDYESVRRDLRIWINRIAVGGLLCGHDADWETVEKAVKEVLPDAQTPPGTRIWFAFITEKEKANARLSKEASVA